MRDEKTERPASMRLLAARELDALEEHEGSSAESCTRLLQMMNPSRKKLPNVFVDVPWFPLSVFLENNDETCTTKHKKDKEATGKKGKGEEWKGALLVGVE